MWLFELCEEEVRSVNGRGAEERTGAASSFSSPGWESAHLSESGSWIAESECLFFCITTQSLQQRRILPGNVSSFHQDESWHASVNSDRGNANLQLPVLPKDCKEQVASAAVWCSGVKHPHLKSALSSLQWCYNYPALSPASCLLDCTLANNLGIIKNMKAFFRIMREIKIMLFSSILTRPLPPSSYWCLLILPNLHNFSCLQQELCLGRGGQCDSWTKQQNSTGTKIKQWIGHKMFFIWSKATVSFRQVGYNGRMVTALFSRSLFPACPEDKLSAHSNWTHSLLWEENPRRNAAVMEDSDHQKQLWAL